MKTTYLLSLAAAALFGLTAQAQTTADLGASAQIIAPPEPASIGIVRNASFGRVAQAPAHECWYEFDPATGALNSWTFGEETGSTSDVGFNDEGCGRDTIAPEAPIISLSCAAGTSFTLFNEWHSLAEARFELGLAQEMSGSGAITISAPFGSSGESNYPVSCGGDGIVQSDFMFGSRLRVAPNPNPTERAIQGTLPLEIVFE